MAHHRQNLIGFEFLVQLPGMDFNLVSLLAVDYLVSRQQSIDLGLRKAALTWHESYAPWP